MSEAKLMNQYLDQDLVSKTKRDRRSVLKNFFNHVGDPLQATETDVENWKQGLVEAGYKGSSVNQMLTVVKNFYNWLNARATDLVSTQDPMEVWRSKERFQRIQEVKRVEETPSETEVHEPGAVHGLVEGARHDRNPAHLQVFVLAAFFGLRRKEIRLLKESNVDRGNQVLHVSRESTKTPAGVRDLPFPDCLRPVLDSDTRFVVGGNQPYGGNWIWKIVTGYGAELTPHSFRHTFNTHTRPVLVQELGVIRGEHLRKKLMGHSTSHDLADLYTGETQQFEENRRKAMTRWHYLMPELEQ